MNIYYIFIVLNGYDEDYGALVIANSAKEAFAITRPKLLNFYLSGDFKGNFSEFIYRKNKQGINQYIYIIQVPQKQLKIILAIFNNHSTFTSIKALSVYQINNI